MHVSILASGSKGNAAVVEGPQGSVLVDCGISWRMLQERAREVGCDLARIRAVLVTHEHADHVSGLPVALRHLEGPVFATPGTAAGRRTLLDIPFTLVDHDVCIDVCGMSIQAFPTSHDVGDPMCFRFEVWDGEGGLVDAIGWVSDTGRLTDEALEQLLGVRILCIECNHDVGMLKAGPYPAYLKARIAGPSGHLSNDQAAEALPMLVTSNTECVVGLHLSEKNNRPSVAVRTLAAALGAEQANPTFTEARSADGCLSICVAAQHRAMRIF